MDAQVIIDYLSLYAARQSSATDLCPVFGSISDTNDWNKLQTLATKELYLYRNFKWLLSSNSKLPFALYDKFRKRYKCETKRKPLINCLTVIEYCCSKFIAYPVPMHLSCPETNFSKVESFLRTENIQKEVGIFKKNETIVR